MKKVIFAVLAIAMFAFVSAQNLEVEKIDKGSVIISEISTPAAYDLIIQNNNPPDNFQIYSLVGVAFTPKEKFTLPTGEKTISVTAQPDEEFRKKSGFFNFEYQIKGDNSGIFKDQMLIKIVPLSEAVEITAAPILPTDKTATIKIKNRENVNLQDLKINFDSSFFSDSRTISLAPYEQKEIQVQVTKDISKMLAGPYILKSQIELPSKTIKFESIIDYLEKEGVSIDEKNEGFIIKKTSITKTNKGNVPVTAQIALTKDAISRLFTINSPSPTSTERNGLSVTYTWQKNVAPTESLVVSSTTNYTIPLIILILAVIVGVFAKIYSQTAIVLNKKVSFVRTKSGDLALKVNIRVKARKHTDKIQIIDVLPGMTKLYEKFGKMPDKIDHNSRRLYWNIPELNAGEERLFSYIIYSKLKVVGKFELPATTAVFEHEGKTKEAWSNRTFFVSGQTV